MAPEAKIKQCKGILGPDEADGKYGTVRNVEICDFEKAWKVLS